MQDKLIQIFAILPSFSSIAHGKPFSKKEFEKAMEAYQSFNSDGILTGKLSKAEKINIADNTFKAINSLEGSDSDKDHISAKEYEAFYNKYKASEKAAFNKNVPLTIDIMKAY